MLWDVSKADETIICQGMNILLTADEHCVGRNVEDSRFQIESTTISAYHCRIYRKRAASENMEHPSNCYFPVFLKDTRLVSLIKVLFVVESQ